MRDLAIWKADLESRDAALQIERNRLLALKDEMEPAIAARALRNLADQLEELENEWLAYSQEARSGQK